MDNERPERSQTNANPRPIALSRARLRDVMPEGSASAPLYPIAGEKVAIRAPSELYSLRPLGLGSAQVESLTSYIRRLALAHREAARFLIAKRILLPSKIERGLNHLSEEPTRVTERVNGANETTALFVQWLTKLTRTPEIRQTCLLGRDEGLDFPEAFRIFRAWCPVCLATDEIPYDRLAWSFKESVVCVRHGCVLEDVCRNCNAHHRALQADAHPHVCARCGADVRSLNVTPRGAHVTSTLLAQVIGRLERGVPITKQQVANGTRAEMHASLGLQALSRACGLAEATLVAIDTMKNRASVASFVALVGISGLSVDAFLDQSPSSRTLRPGVGGRRPQPRKAPLSLRYALEAHLKLPDDQLVSLRAFARAQGHTDMFVRVSFPELSAELVERWAAHRRAGRLALEASNRARFRDAFERIRSETGEVPSRFAVSKCVGGALRAPYLQAFFQQLVNEHHDASDVISDRAAQTTGGTKE